MRACLFIWGLLMVMLLNMGTAAGGQEGLCPEGMVWGGLKCEWRDICPDGSPSIDGACSGDQIRCPPGRVFRDGTCEDLAPKSCPHGYQRVEGVCKPVKNRDTVTARPIPVCEKGVVFASRSSGSRVLLINGDAGSLLEQYFSEAKQKKVAVDFESLSVIIFESQKGQVTYRGGREVKMTTGLYFKGKTWPQIWVRALKGKRAAERLHPMADAKHLEADVICGSG